MALQCLAVIGKANEPLFLMDTETVDTQDQPDDAFGFAAANREHHLSLRKEFMMHAALDSIEESMQRQGRGRSSSDTKWIGLLCPMEASYIYGYVTTTNIKIIVMLAASAELNREVHLKTLFAKVHNLFVEYMLNPWSTMQSKIESKKFTTGVQDAVEVYNKTLGMSWA